MDVAEIVDALLVTGAVTVWPCPEDEAGPTAAAVGRVIEDTKPFRLGDPDDLTDNERRMALADILTARGNGHPVIVFSEGPPAGVLSFSGVGDSTMGSQYQRVGRWG